MGLCEVHHWICIHWICIIGLLDSACTPGGQVAGTEQLAANRTPRMPNLGTLGPDCLTGVVIARDHAMQEASTNRSIA
jgi:hypothetical protein